MIWTWRPGYLEAVTCASVVNSAHTTDGVKSLGIKLALLVNEAIGQVKPDNAANDQIGPARSGSQGDSVMQFTLHRRGRNRHAGR